jgi:hypothetical protein
LRLMQWQYLDGLAARKNLCKAMQDGLTLIRQPSS